MVLCAGRGIREVALFEAFGPARPDDKRPKPDRREPERRREGPRVLFIFLPCIIKFNHGNTRHESSFMNLESVMLES